MRTVALLLALVLVACDTGSRDGNLPDLQWDYMSLSLEGFESPNPQPTTKELGYWLETIESIGRTVEAVTGLRKQQSYVVVHYDRNSLLWAFLQSGPPSVNKSGLFRFPANVPLREVYGYRDRGVVHVEQGNLQTLAGLAAHMLTHVWLQDQVGNEDASHILSSWGGWDQDYIAESLRLELQR